MEITKITLENIRCFEKFEVDLKSGDGAKKWMVILGDNGVGKTTLLRSIALGLCEESGAAGLIGEVFGDMIRYGAKKGTIRLEIKPHAGYNDLAFIETTLKRNDYGEVDTAKMNEWYSDILKKAFKYYKHNHEEYTTDTFVVAIIFGMIRNSKGVEKVKEQMDTFIKKPTDSTDFWALYYLDNSGISVYGKIKNVKEFSGVKKPRIETGKISRYTSNL